MQPFLFAQAGFDKNMAIQTKFITGLFAFDVAFCTITYPFEMGMTFMQRPRGELGKYAAGKDE